MDTYFDLFTYIATTKKVFEHDKDCQCEAHSITPTTPSGLLTIMSTVNKPPDTTTTLKNKKFYYEIGML